MLKIMDYHANPQEVYQLLAGRAPYDAEALVSAEQIFSAIQAEGDEALEGYCQRFGWKNPAEAIVSQEEIAAAYQQVDADFLAAIRLAIENVRCFHARQIPQGGLVPEADGTILGSLYIPVERAGIYAPGGTAAYPSSVVMGVVPAILAGVREVVLATPPGPDGRVNPATLVAAAESGVHEIWKLGGVRGIAVMAMGTETFAPVMKIAGPGNKFVTAAKRIVYGKVDIDMLAGPSEILVIADATADPVYIAADLLSQAEHDEMAGSVLLTDCPDLAVQVVGEVERQMAKLSRRGIATQSIDNFGAVIIVKDIAEACQLADEFAPEHLEIITEDPLSWVGKIRHAGSVFLGPWTPEPVGDYLAGSNHILPTGRTARYFSGLGLTFFLRRMSVIGWSKERLLAQGHHIVKLATVEGLDGHATAVKKRLERLMD